ncbi:hypothetical protein HYALB_00007431 [Hymenoscyphus albidus]|uniref:Uncharacterized protein n=1 Tax=Hymenoscyphus albidus TaxID=595503 RepID=A0A9N9LYD8_9HELO|nr:hypothetical protein HYALB_00007431 [Hymenoscyphus albidus]
MPRIKNNFMEAIYAARSRGKRWVKRHDLEYRDPTTTPARRKEILMHVMENLEAQTHTEYRPRPRRRLPAAPVAPAASVAPVTSAAPAPAPAPRPLRRSPRFA